MTCPKCKSENAWGNFCSNCGNPLWEKCQECGEMEPIGRTVCNTKFEEAIRKNCIYSSGKNPYQNIEPAIIVLACPVSMLVSFLIINSLILLNEDWKIALTLFCSLLFGILVAIIIAVKSYRYNNRVGDEIDVQFTEEFPAEAKILRKGGIIK